MPDNISVDLETLFPLIQQKLNQGGDVTFGPKGVSMLPIIRQGIDSVKISPLTSDLKKYDVPLYRRSNGQFVLHRIVGINNGSYVMCGDNQFIREKDITRDMIIGVMSEIIKPDGVIKTNDKSYISYSRRQVRKQYVKWVLWNFKSILKKLFMKLHLYK